MQTFKLSKEYEVVCRSERTRYGFRHLATMLRNNCEVAQAKCCYYNRTWERYEFQSVLHEVIRKHFDEKEAKKYIAKVDGKPKENEQFKAVGLACAIGELLCDKPEEKNAWKKKMLGTIPGINFPEDFDSLPEEEKQRRLNGAVDIMTKKEE